MKKFFLLSLFCFVVIISIFSQNNKFNIGIEGGPTIRLLIGNGIVDTFPKYSTGFCYGLFLQNNFNHTFSLNSNLLFERKGGFNQGSYLNEYNKTIYWKNYVNYDYLTLPVLIRAERGQRIKIFLIGGPFFSYLIKQFFEYSSSMVSTTFIVNNTNNLKIRFDAGITAGIGFTFPIKNKFFISCEIRDNFGLYNISEYPLTYRTTTNSTNLLLGFAYKFSENSNKTQ